MLHEAEAVLRSGRLTAHDVRTLWTVLQTGMPGANVPLVTLRLDVKTPRGRTQVEVRDPDRLRGMILPPGAKRRCRDWSLVATHAGATGDAPSAVTVHCFSCGSSRVLVEGGSPAACGEFARRVADFVNARAPLMARWPIPKSFGGWFGVTAGTALLAAALGGTLGSATHAAAMFTSVLTAGLVQLLAAQLTTCPVIDLDDDGAEARTDEPGLALNPVP